VYAPCDVHLGHAIGELRVFAERVTHIRVIREFDYSEEGTFANDIEMLKAIHKVCPLSQVAMHTTQRVDEDDLWRVVRPFMKPPSITNAEWETRCYQGIYSVL
jgi:hypothetical protein